MEPERISRYQHVVRTGAAGGPAAHRFHEKESSREKLNAQLTHRPTHSSTDTAEKKLNSLRLMP
jgi:hypothetical protein